MTSFAVQFLWGLVVLSGFIGWGFAVAWAIGRRRPDWGLGAGWGMAAMLFVGGVLSLLGLAYPPVLILVVVAGAGVHLKVTLKGRGGSAEAPPGQGLSRPAVVLLVLVGVVLAGRYASAVWLQASNCADDEVAYFTFVTRLLQTGTLIEPFSLRRLSGYGGHTFLQALVMAAGSEDQGFLMDRGIAVIVSFGLIAGFFPRTGINRVVPYVLALIFTVVLPFPHANSSSHITGLAMALTLFRTLYLIETGGRDQEKDQARRLLWLAGLVAAGAAALKAHLMLGAAAAVFFFWLAAVFYAGKEEGGGRGRHAVTLGHLGGSMLVFLLPWMALLWRSSGTVLFPLFQGNQRPGFSETYSGSVDLAFQLGRLGELFSSPQIALFTVPLLLYAVRRGPAAGLGLYMGGLVTAAVTTLTLTYDNVIIIYRFAAPFLNGAFMVTVAYYLNHIRGGLADANKPSGAARIGDRILFVLVLVLMPFPVYHDVQRLKTSFGQTVLTDERRAAYGRMQNAIPEGEAMLAVLDRPFALDYRRNPVFNADVPGAVSPDPGMPFFKGPAALKDYLVGRSIAYVGFRDFDVKGGCLYRRDYWEIYAKGANPMWRAQSKYYLDLMDNLSALAKTGTVLYRGDGLSVIRIDQ